MPRNRYGAWRGGPDPLAPPYDVREAVDAIGQDVLEGRSLAEAIRDLLRRGDQGRRGLDDLQREVRRRREQVRNAGDLSGTLEQVRDLLDQAISAEQEALFPDPSDDARLREQRLGDLPRDTSRAVRELARLRLALAGGQGGLRRDQGRCCSGRCSTSSSQGMRDALQGNDPEAMARTKDMLADLNQLLGAHARGEDTTDQFNDFMAKHGEMFPDNPQSVDELIDALARQAAAAERLMRSLSSQQRQELAQLMADALADADLAAEMAALRDNLRDLRPGPGLAQPRQHRRRPAADLRRGHRGVAGAGRPRRAHRPARRRTTRARRWTTSTWRPSSGSSARARPPTSRRCASWSASCAARAGWLATTTGSG